MIDHPVFRRFADYRHAEDDWTGATFPVELAQKRPSHDEELFEWLALIEAVTEARGRFRMLELGAGYGRWGIWGACAARSFGIEDIAVRLVEAEPQHAAWARESAGLNGLEHEVTVIEAAISNGSALLPFAIDIPSEKYDAVSWYGQSVIGPGNAPAEPTTETYFGRPVYRNQWFGQIYVQPISLGQATEGFERIDLIDADLQGAETELIPWLPLISERVRLIHIGTHGTEIEGRLRDAFRSRGWLCQADYSLQGERDTPFGKIHFGDGAQTWRNPNL